MHDKQIRRLAVTQNGKVIGTITERIVLESLISKHLKLRGVATKLPGSPRRG